MEGSDTVKICRHPYFLVYLNDLQEFFFNNYPNVGIECFSSKFDDAVHLYVKIFILLYADDTVILSDSSEGLQTALNLYSQYCTIWKLNVNMNK